MSSVTSQSFKIVDVMNIFYWGKTIMENIFKRTISQASVGLSSEFY